MSRFCDEYTKSVRAPSRRGDERFLANRLLQMSLKDETTAKDREELRLFAGLCASCVHVQALRNARSCFVRCALSDLEESYPRYPRLPVRWCAGYRAVDS